MKLITIPRKHIPTDDNYDITPVRDENIPIHLPSYREVALKLRSKVNKK